eukprot:4917524-Prorocentrum_lima.AAC.1
MTRLLRRNCEVLYLKSARAGIRSDVGYGDGDCSCARRPARNEKSTGAARVYARKSQVCCLDPAVCH